MLLLDRRKGRRRETRIEFTPLIDCAFILIIFFAVSTTLITTRAGIDVNLPGAATAEAKPINVQISIREDRNIYFEDTQVTDDMLRKMVGERIAEEPLSAFIISSDRVVPYELLIHVLDLLRGAGAERIALAAEKEFSELEKISEGNETEEE